MNGERGVSSMPYRAQDRLLEQIDGERRKAAGKGRCLIVAIDGRSASGKTTLAESLAEKTKAGVVHMDDFFLPQELRTKERFREPGGNVHYERFCREALPALAAGGDFDYVRFDCGRMALGDRCHVDCSSGIVIVEGAYSCHPVFGDYMDIRAFCDVTDQEARLARICRRSGESAVEQFRRRWIPLEEAYFEAFRIREKAHIVLYPAEDI